MIIHSILTLFFLLAAPILAAAELPKEVAEFVDRRELCEHFRQEPWPEGTSTEEHERRDFIVNQIKQFCTGSDEVAQKLRRKYKNEQAVIEKLDKFENVEWGQ